MILLRNKLFARRDILPDDRKFRADVKLIEQYGIPSVYLGTTKQYAEDKKLLGPVLSKIVDGLRKDLRAGYIYDDGPNRGDTHWLKDFSNKNSIMMSKRISDSDRLNYRIKPPTLIPNPTNKSELIYVIPVTIERCYGHSRLGTKGYTNTHSEL